MTTSQPSPQPDKHPITHTTALQCRVPASIHLRNARDPLKESPPGRASHPMPDYDRPPEDSVVVCCALSNTRAKKQYWGEQTGVNKGENQDQKTP